MTEQEIKDLFCAMYGSRTIKYMCDHLLPVRGWKKSKMTFGVWCSAEHQEDKARNRVRDKDQVILRATFSIWHAGRRKFVSMDQWNTRTTQNFMEKNAKKRIKNFVKIAEKHLKKRIKNFSEERYEYGVDVRAMYREHYRRK